jgi:hypothetical protein
VSAEAHGGHAQVLVASPEVMRRDAQDQGVRVDGLGAHAEAKGVRSEVLDVKAADLLPTLTFQGNEVSRPS